ncbi:hypothetical protein [Brevibacillus sp. HD1.4A]|uniref:hypothetical protein n=1 Tax=Brevibacillus sp. HD1.4A TaxID=2738978 RepID=UPI00156AEDCB|nr:hypothetical protein [Brevibacillus sp. HD1.4A]NRQ56085.1 hypothetical protein [Brevibacillus sp. HD1.4A]
MKITVYYDYLEEKLAPIWYVVSFRKGEFDWSKNTLYIPVEAPFQRQGAEDFHSDTLGLSVTLGDLTLNHEKPGKFGIHLPSLRQRAAAANVDHWEVEQFIIQVCDIEELLQMNVFSERIA